MLCLYPDTNTIQILPVHMLIACISQPSSRATISRTVKRFQSIRAGGKTIHIWFVYRVLIINLNIQIKFR